MIGFEDQARILGLAILGLSSSRRPSRFVHLFPDNALEGREHSGKNLESEVFLIAQAIRAALDDTDFVVQSLHEAEGHLVLGLAVGRDPLPMAIDHLGEAVEGLEPLPFERRPPVVEEAPGPAFAVVAPELTEGLLEHVGRVQSLVGSEQKPEALFPVEGQILPVGQEGILLALDEAAAFARDAHVLALPHRVERVTQVTQHVELVEQDARLRRVGASGVAKRLPHVHHHQADPRAVPGSQPREELIQAGLGAVHAAEPDRPATQEVADDDPIAMPLPDRHLVNADDLRRGPAGAPQLDLHEDPHTSAGQVAHPAHRAIVDTPVNLPAYSTSCFFERRTSLTMRRWGSPKTPTIVCRGRKPGNRYESERRRRGLEDRIPQSCQVSASAQPRSNPLPERVPAPPTHLFDPHESPKTQSSDTSCRTLTYRGILALSPSRAASTSDRARRGLGAISGSGARCLRRTPRGAPDPAGCRPPARAATCAGLHARGPGR